MADAVLAALAGWRDARGAERDAWLAAGAAIPEALLDCGHLALAQVGATWLDGAARLADEPGGADHDALVAAWPELLERHLGDPRATPASALVDHLGDPRWPEPLGEDDRAMLVELLEEDGGVGARTPALPEAPGFAEAPVLDDSTIEICELLASELAILGADLAGVLDDAAASSHVAEQVGRFGEAAGSVGLAGVSDACARFVTALEAGDGPPAAVFGSFSTSIGGWLEAPCEARASADVVDAVRLTVALDGPDLEALRTGLRTPPETDEALEMPPRATHATPEDVRLELPEDVDPELLESLLEELPIRAADFSGAVQRLVVGGDLGDIEVAQRAAHTAKGAANTVGIVGLANLSHHVEDILSACMDAGYLPGGELGDLLVDVADGLECMSEALAGTGSAPADTLGLLQRVMDWANRIDDEGLPERSEDAHAGETTVHEPEAADTAASEPPSTHETEAAEAPAPDAAPPSVTPSVRISADRVDALLRLVGESMLLGGQVHERVRTAFDRTRAVRAELARFQQLGYDLEQLLDLKDLSGPNLRVVDDDFDPLELDQYNELHTVTRRLVESATDARELSRDVESELAGLEGLMGEQSRINRETHEAVLGARMVAVRSVVPRLARSVRQAARQTGKIVGFEARGDDTLIDSELLSEMVDPLMHVLRNAVDHGIESTEVRAARGKSPEGRIEVAFAREGAQVVVRCADDGGGLDFDAIRHTAVERGLLASAQGASEEELGRLVLTPGFSTRRTATQTSGRGVGLDAVHTRVTELGGFFLLRNRADGGCVAELRLPLTLISAHAVVVRAQRHLLAIANRGVEQILPPDPDALREIAGELTLRVGDALYPAVTLESLLNLAPDQRAEERVARFPLLARGPEGLRAVLVQEVLSTRDVVVKNMGRYVPKLRGVGGATILGDGTVTPVIDLPELLRGVVEPTAVAPALDLDGGEPEASVDAARPSALVVDDSLSARRALIRVMEEYGYEVREARDGVEAAEMLRGMRPDVLLVDLEMPRMNGLELTGHVRAQPGMADLPVIMVTSRSSAKHRQMARDAGVTAYLTKPFSDGDLLARVDALRHSA